VCMYCIAENLCMGSSKSLSKNKEDYDLLELKTIYLNQAREPEVGTCLHLLHTLFSSSLPSEERARILEKNYSITFNQEERKMFDMFRYAEENGIKKGKQIGLSEGRQEELDKNITNMIMFQLTEKASIKDIIRMLTNVFNISVSEAERRIKSVSTAMI